MGNQKKQNVHFGEEGALGFVKEFLTHRKKGSSVFIVIGKKSFSSSGSKKFFKKILSNIPKTFFQDFSSNPKIEDVEKGLKLFNSIPHSIVIAIGGGSVMDIGKSINFFASNRTSPNKYLKNKTNLSKPCSPMMAVPTTAGTGSEATQFSVFYDKMIKQSIDNSSILPSDVLLNPKFTESQSPYVTACSGMDAFAQGIESYWAVGATSKSIKYSEKCIKICLKHLEKAVLRPNKKHREEMLRAAYFSGKAISISRTTASHALSYPMTAHYGLAHGHAVALSLPIIVRINGKITLDNINPKLELYPIQKRIQNLYSLFGKNYKMEDVAKLLEKLILKIGLSQRWFAEIKKCDILEVRNTVVKEVDQNRLQNNPRKIDKDEIIKITKQIN